MTFDSGQEIRDRTFRYACDVGRFTFSLTQHSGWRCIIQQLLRSGTSVGANLEEAKAASSWREFIRFVEIALREARESVFWLRLCAALRPATASQLAALQDEGEQIARVLAAIVITAKRHT